MGTHSPPQSVEHKPPFKTTPFVFAGDPLESSLVVRGTNTEKTAHMPPEDTTSTNQTMSPGHLYESYDVEQYDEGEGARKSNSERSRLRQQEE